MPEHALNFFSLEQFGQETSWPSCTCWDIPRSDCCYCGARVYDEVLAENNLRVTAKTQHSYDMACWAFGTGVFA